MKKVIILIIFIGFLQACSIVRFDDPNDYIGYVIIDEKLDNVGSIKIWAVGMIKDKKYTETIFKPRFRKFFQVGDTIDFSKIDPSKLKLLSE